MIRYGQAGVNIKNRQTLSPIICTTLFIQKWISSRRKSLKHLEHPSSIQMRRFYCSQYIAEIYLFWKLFHEIEMGSRRLVILRSIIELVSFVFWTVIPISHVYLYYNVKKGIFTSDFLTISFDDIVTFGESSAIRTSMDDSTGIITLRCQLINSEEYIACWSTWKYIPQFSMLESLDNLNWSRDFCREASPVYRLVGAEFGDGIAQSMQHEERRLCAH